MAKRIEDVIAEEASSLMEISGVTGVGETKIDGKKHIVVMLTHSSPEIEAAIPSTLDDYPVVLEVTGVIQTQRREPSKPH